MIQIQQIIMTEDLQEAGDKSSRILIINCKNIK